MNKWIDGMSDLKNINLENEDVLNLLQELKKNPEMTQRELSSRLGISLGKINFLLRALVWKGIIKAKNFKNSKNKSAYFYYLTPEGFEVKTRLTYYFLKRKIREYEDIEEEIRRLRDEIEEAEGSLEINT